MPAFDRAAAWSLLAEFTRSQPLRRHGLAVEATMRALARSRGVSDPAEVEKVAADINAKGGRAIAVPTDVTNSQALEALAQAPHGAAVLLNCTHETDALLPQLLEPGHAPASARPQIDLRTYGVGAQILRELGVRRMRLLGSPRRMPSMAGFGLEVTGFVAP